MGVKIPGGPLRIGVDFVVCCFALLLLSGQGEAQPICEPIKNTPELSFTMASFETGGLDQECAGAISRAVAKGFTAITLVPARVFYQNQVIQGPTVSQEEIWRCLNLAWKSKLHIIYQPHLESDYLINPHHPNVWRANFDFYPQDDYRKQMMDPFLTWLESNKSSILKSNRLIHITLAAELEISTTKYGAAWKALTDDTRNRLRLMGLGGRVQLGYDPNWWPMAAMKDAQGCSTFRQFIQSLDYVAPSLYGDWSHIRDGFGALRGAAQVNDKYAEVIGRLTHLPQTSCSVPEMAQKNFSIGEFGVGGEITETEKEDAPAMKIPGVIGQRRDIYSNILSWAHTQPAKDQASRAVINIWTGGVFDPVGILPNGDTVVDDGIAQQFVDYTQWRCRRR